MEPGLGSHMYIAFGFKFFISNNSNKYLFLYIKKTTIIELWKNNIFYIYMFPSEESKELDK